MRVVAGAILALALLSAPAGAAANGAPFVLAAADREVPRGRAVLVTLTQDQIGTSVEIGRVAPNASGGGLLGALIIYAQDDRSEILTESAHQRAEATARPLREALEGFELDSLALATTRSGLANAAWFGAQEPIIGMANSPQAQREFALSAGSDQVAFVSYSYDLSPDFTQFRVFADIVVSRKTRRGEPVILMEQRVASIVQLSQRSYDPRENVAVWSADGGEPAKVALRNAFAQFEWLLPKALGLSIPDIDSFADKRREKAFAAGLYGPLVERGHARRDDVLIWVDGLVFVQMAP